MQFRTSLSNPLQGFFLRMQFSKWQRADLIIPDDAGILCFVFNGFCSPDLKTVKILEF